MYRRRLTGRALSRTLTTVTRPAAAARLGRFRLGRHGLPSSNGFDVTDYPSVGRDPAGLDDVIIRVTGLVFSDLASGWPQDRQAKLPYAGVRWPKVTQQ